MAAKKQEDVQDIEEKSESKASKFQPFGKYFLIILMVLGQGYLAYSFVDGNYEEIYSTIDSFTAAEPGTYQLEKLVVNPAGTNGHRYLLVELSLELASMDDVEVLKTKKQKIRHNLIQFLSSQTVQQLESFKRNKQLRQELISIINTAIGGHSVRNLYYTRYVMQ